LLALIVTWVAAPMYERAAPPPKVSASALTLLAQAQSWRPLELDARLTAAARAYLRRDPGSQIDLGILRTMAQRRGWTDGHLAAVALPAATSPLAPHLTREVGHFPANRVGVAVLEEQALMLFSEHLIDLAPTPARLHGGQSLHLHGTAPAARLEAVLGVRTGVTRRLPLHQHADAFSLKANIGAAPTLVDVQILIDRGRGPEVAALFPVGVDMHPWPQVSAFVMPSIEQFDDTEHALAEGIAELRSAQGLPVPVLSAELAEVAQSHARDMGANRFLAHVSPASGDLTARLEVRGLALHAYENIAAVRGDEAARVVEEILKVWMQSPSHRGNLLQPKVTQLGVGLAQAAGDNSLYYAAVVLAP
jgi:hypothetical protein